MVYGAALAEAEKLNGELLETCDEGTKCREDVELEMRGKIITIWKQVLQDFNDSITSSIVGTRTLVDDAWIKLVECGEDANCCHYQEVTIQNLWIQVTNYRANIVSESAKWMEFESRREAIVERCPLVSFACANTCYDGSARD